MSSVKEITILRQQGKLKEAYNLAENLISHEPGEWANMAMFWVLRDMALQYSSNPTIQNIEKGQQCLQRMEKLKQDMVGDPDIINKSMLDIKKALIPNYSKLKQYGELSKTNPCQAYEQAVSIAGTQAENLDVVLHEDFGWILYRYFKARLNELSSVEVRGLLRDYIMLKNNRPSMLHSTILNFALNFAKSHPDFIFPNFLKLWGISNFRDDDLKDGYNNGDTIPSLISRICAQLSMTDTPLVEEVAEETNLPITAVADMHRKYWFWYLFELQKANRMADFWEKINAYTNNYRLYTATKWHSDILKLTTRKVDDMHVHPFLNMMLGCKDVGFCAGDWISEKGKDGNEFQPFAVQFAKKCFELIKTHYKFQSNTDLIKALSHVYDQIEDHKAGDEWTTRHHAILYAWMGDKQCAVTRYRDLLKEMGDKYYIWQEMAQFIDEASLRVGFLLRALELEKTEDLIGPLRLQTAEALLEIGFTAEARIYLDYYAAHRKKQGKSCPDKWKALEDKVNKSTIGGNTSFDTKQAVLNAMNYAYSDYPWQEYVLTDSFILKDKPKVAFTDGEYTFIVSPERFGITNQIDLGTVVRARCLNDGTNTTPLMLLLTDAPKWSALPKEFGYVVYVNEVNCAVSVITSKSEETYFFDEKNTFKTGDFISFHRYTRKRKEGTIIAVVNPQVCTKQTALRNFKQCIVVVDDVNQQKALFHIAIGAGIQSDIVRFKDTELRPEIGDFLKITYCISKDKEGNKRIVILDLQTTEETNSKIVKDVEGWLEIKSKYDDDSVDFGFVNDIYVPKNLLQKFHISSDCRVKAKAVINGEGKWRVFDLELL